MGTRFQRMAIGARGLVLAFAANSSCLEPPRHLSIDQGPGSTGGADTDACPRGTLGCPCTEFSTCNWGATCWAMTCIPHQKSSGSGASTTAGATSESSWTHGSSASSGTEGGSTGPQTSSSDTHDDGDEASTGGTGPESSESATDTGSSTDDEAGDTDEDNEDSSDVHGDTCIKAEWRPSLECPSVVGFSTCSEGATQVDESEMPMWKLSPPSSGPHYEKPVDWGEHTETLNPGYWLENLHQGGVVLLYNCDDDTTECATALDKLRNVLRDVEHPQQKIVLAPDPTLAPNARYAAISWTWRYQTDRVSLTTFRCFVDQHVDQVPPEDAAMLTK